MNKHTILLYKANRILGFILFAYMSILSIAYSQNHYYQPIITIIIGLFLIFIFRMFVLKTSISLVKKLVFVVILLSLFIRLLWIIIIPTEPFSDFLAFHQSAINLSIGNETYFKSPGYVLLLSLCYCLYPHYISGKLLNVIVSTLSMLFTYFCAKKLTNEKEGVIALTLFAIMPSEIVMTSVLGTENIAAFFGIFLLFVTTQSLISKPSSTKWVFILGMVYGLALTIRSSFLFYLPGIILWLFWSDFPSFRKIGYSLLITGTGILAGLLMILLGYFASTSHFSTKYLQSQDSFPFLAGTNFLSNGRWTPEDAELFFSWPADQRNQLSRKEAFTRIKSDPIGFLLLIPRKMYWLMAPNDYGNYWSLKNVEVGNNFDLWIALLSQSVYVIIMISTLCSFTAKGNLSRVSYIVLIILLLTLTPHTILEVQARYHHYIVSFLCLSAAHGIRSHLEDSRIISNLEKVS